MRRSKITSGRASSGSLRCRKHCNTRAKRTRKSSSSERPPLLPLALLRSKTLVYCKPDERVWHCSINDYGTESLNSKSDTLYSVVQGFLRDGVPVDGIGFQCHFTLGQVPDTIAPNLARFANLGLEVAITELDINMRGPANESALEQQARDYWTVVDACVSTTKCVGVVRDFLFLFVTLCLIESMGLLDYMGRL